MWLTEKTKTDKCIVTFQVMLMLHTPGRSSPQTWGVRGVELYNYNSWLRQSLLRQPWEQRKYMPQFEDKYTTGGKPIHVLQFACNMSSWNHPKYYITWLDADHIPRGWFRWLTLQDEFLEGMRQGRRVGADIISHSDPRNARMSNFWSMNYPVAGPSCVSYQST